MNWINEAVMYNIYPLGFAGAPRENDFKLEYRLDKIYDWIDNFKKLGVNTIVFNPVFESTRHGYDTIDYYKIDSRLGAYSTTSDVISSHLRTFSKTARVLSIALGLLISTSAETTIITTASATRAGQAISTLLS